MRTDFGSSGGNNMGTRTLSCAELAIGDVIEAVVITVAPSAAVFKKSLRVCPAMLYPSFVFTWLHLRKVPSSKTSFWNPGHHCHV
jgi:hypothetical protein